MSLWCCGPSCTSKMLPLHVSVTPPGALHCTLKSPGVRNTLPVCTLIRFCVSLFRGYHGPFDLYPEFYQTAIDPTIHNVSEGQPINVSVGEE